MTKQELIGLTEYSEEQIINLALCAFKDTLIKFRDNPENRSDDWFHYNDLRNAADAILQSRLEVQ